MTFDVRPFINASWFVFGVVWMIWAAGAKETVKRQSRRSRWIQAAAVMPAFAILFSGGRISDPSAMSEYVALVLDIGGMAFAIWARIHLGGNWSANVTVKRDHVLIQSGPYSVVRHPIYSGISLAALGLVVLNGDLRSIAAFGLMLFGWRLKFREEEQFMTEQFGEAYRSYKQRVKALIPFVW